MEPFEADASFEKKPHVAMVLGAVLGAAALFSWLGCYAVVGVLQAHEVISPFSAGHDPRLRWFLQSFFVLVASFATLALVVHFFARQHMRTMELIEHEEA